MTSVTLAERIRECAQLVGSGDELSRKTGIPRSTLETYLSGRATPNATRVAVIAVTARVSPEWLLLGKGQRQPRWIAPIEAEIARARLFGLYKRLDQLLTNKKNAGRA